MDDMKNIIGCEFNDDNGCVEVAYKDGNFLIIKCEEVEAKLQTTEQSLTKLIILSFRGRLVGMRRRLVIGNGSVGR